MNLPDPFNLGYLPFGIDIGSGWVRLLQLHRRGRELEATAAARIEIPDSPAGPGSDAQLASLRAALSERLSAGDFHGKACVIALDDRLIRVRSVRHPRMPDDELDRAIALDGPGRLGFPESEPIELGWLRAGEVRQGEEYRDEVIIVGTSRDPVERLVFALAEIGLRPLAVEPSFVAAARAFSRTLRRSADQGVVKIVADVGLLSTNVTIIRGQSVAFHKPIEIGGLAMTQAAASRLGMEHDAILDLRRQRIAGAPIEARVDRALFEAVRSTIMDIANEVSLCLRYFGVSFRGSRADECILAGGDAGEPHFTELVGEVLHLPTTVGHPLNNVSLDRVAPMITPEFDSAWAVATGLGMRTLRSARADAPPGGTRRLAELSAKPVHTAQSIHQPRRAA